jgi:putative nucleotidyltransferase with HDIG domain
VSTAAPAAPVSSPRDPNALISVVACAAAVAIALTASEIPTLLTERPRDLIVFFGLTMGLMLVSVPVYGRGAVSFAGTALLALGFALGPGVAMSTAAAMGFFNLARRRGRLNRGIYDASQWALAAGGGATVYLLLATDDLLLRIAAALAAAVVYMVLNIGLLCVAMGMAERAHPLAVWKERFRWFTPYYLASGPLALTLVIAYEKTGVLGLLAFALPPAFMMLSVHQYLARTRKSVEELHATNEELAERNADLRALLDVSGGLAAQAHDRDALIAYVEGSISDLTGGRARITAPGAGDVDLVSGGTTVGALLLAGGERFDVKRWERLRDVVLPQLATAIESADLVEQVRRTHLATIAALSRSMAAKDGYTGGHTERVSDIAVALARRLGYESPELDAIQIGALLHDIGKIGIPERILHKPGPLDEEEWKVMKQHPVTSEHILSGIGLSPIVLQIARSSHERIDGGGYPDGLQGDEVPLPARIVLVADAFDALTSDRPYRDAAHASAAMDEMRSHAGTQFCSQVIGALEEIYREEPARLGLAPLRLVDVA